MARIKILPPKIEGISSGDLKNFANSAFETSSFLSGINASKGVKLLLSLLYILIISTGLFLINRVETYNDISIEKNTGKAIINKRSPSFFSPYDVSQSKYEISPLKEFTKDTICIDLEEIAVFTPHAIDPDQRTLTAVYYTDKNKIKEINEKGLSFYAMYPDYKNIQSIRFFILTALFTIVLQSIINLTGNFLALILTRIQEAGVKKSTPEERKIPS